MSRPYEHLMDHDHWRETSLDAVVAARDEYPGLRLTRCSCGMWFLPQGKSLNAVTCTPCYWAERKAREKAEARREWNQAIRNGYIPLRGRPTPPESDIPCADHTPDEAPAGGQLNLLDAA